MRVLLTGGAGFVSRYLAAGLCSAGYEVWRTDCRDAKLPNYRKVDLTDREGVRELVAEVRPDAVVHLGAISFVPDAARNGDMLERVNVGGTRNLLKALVSVKPQNRPDWRPRFLFVSTAQVYMKDLSSYAMSKMAGEALALQYCREGIDAVIARPANHTGPGQDAKFVVPSFIRQALEIKAGGRSRFMVGNLDSIRDFTDVRDIARAYRLLLERGKTTGVYAIGSSNHLPMRELLAKIARAVGVPNAHEVSPLLWRPSDTSVPLDTAAIHALGWRPHFTLDATISDMVSAASRMA